MWRELEAVWERRQSELVTGAAVPQSGPPGGVSAFGSCFRGLATGSPKEALLGVRLVFLSIQMGKSRMTIHGPYLL